MRKIKLVISIFFSLVFHQAYSQYYTVGNDPGSIKWMQIKTENFQVIYPQGFSEKAQTVANLLEQAYDYTTYSLKRKPKKVSLILHNQTAISNGMAAWAPKRMEWYAPPVRDGYAQDWFEQLAIHEHRHIIQMDKLNQGLTKVFSIVFGQQATAVVLGLYVPQWFLEGDAVTTETLLSKCGRGRKPDFNKDMKAQLIQKGAYSYDKAVFGSYQHNVPNHYKLGYLLVSEGRDDYGSELWERTLSRVAKTPYSINPFSRSLKKETGFHKCRFYENTMDSLKQKWLADKKQQTIKHAHRITIPVEWNYAKYLYPYKQEDGSFVSIKTSMEDAPYIVITQNDGFSEKKVHGLGYMPDYQMSYENGKACWSEYIFDKRWEMRSSTAIKVLDIQSGYIMEIKSKKKYYTPKLSKDATLLAAVEISERNEYSMHIMRVANQKKNNIAIVDSIKVNDFLLTDPSWNSDNSKITFIAFDKNRGKSIYVYDLGTKKHEEIFGPTYKEISEPQFYKDFIIFNAGFSGVDNFYALNLDNNKAYQLTYSEYGAKYASIENDKLVYSDYTADGYMIAESDIALNEINLESEKYDGVKISSKLLSQERGVIDFDESKFKRFEERNYSKIANLINIHSWAPFYIDANNFGTNPGVSLFSQNKLSTAITTLGYEWDLNERRGIYRGSFAYTGWYPTISIGFDHTQRWTNYTDSSMVDTTKVYWDEMSASFAIGLPLSWSSGAYVLGASSQISTSYFDRSNLSLEGKNFKLENYQSLEYDFIGYRYKRAAKRDLFPRFGQIIKGGFKHTPLHTYDLGKIYSMETRFYFPGALKHNHIIVDAGLQRRNVDNEFGFANLIKFPRGHIDVLENNFNYIYCNYALPLGYPDYSLGSIAYVKRFKTNMFFDYGENNRGRVYSSYGIDFTADMHLFRFLAPIEMGIRNVYVPQSNSLFMEILFGVGFYDI